MKTLTRSVNYIATGSFYASLCAATLLAAGCIGEPAEPTTGPKVVFLDGGVARTTLDLGSVVLPGKITRSIRVTNTGDTAAKLKLGSALESFALTAPYARISGATDECKDLQVLEADESCSLTLEFTPKKDGVFSATVHAPYTAAAALEGMPITVSDLVLTATAKLGYPILQIQADGANSTPSSQFDFGSVNVLKESTQYLRITNSGTATAKLNLGANLDKLKTNAPFFVLDGGTCQDQQLLEVGTPGCTIAVQFSPIVDGSAASSLEISYFSLGVAEANLNVAATVLFSLSGKSVLNCAVDPVLAAKRADGVQKANDQMVLDAARGKAEGEALTPAEGTRDGDARGYSDGYYTGYHGAEGYDKGYAEGKAQGLARGKTDTASCSRGTFDGTTTGANDGRAKGKADGYKDGYTDGLALGKLSGFSAGQTDGLAIGRSDGYRDGKNVGAADGYEDGYAAGDNAGYEDGYDDGLLDARSDCSNGAKALGNRAPVISRPEADIAALGTACYNQGYGATYSTAAYTNAYNAAKAANVPYQQAYTAAYTSAHARGVTAGKAQGYIDGKAKGDADGFKEGSAQYYKSCYDAAYPMSYNSAYTQSYQANYTIGKVDGYADGYNSAYKSGYDQGYAQGHLQTYGTGYNDTYPTAFNKGKVDGYANGYEDGYVDGYDDGHLACRNKTKVLRKSRTGSLRERALRNQPVRGAQLRLKSPTQNTADAIESGLRKSLRSQAYKSALSKVLKTIQHQ